jgi:hypothetical protein
MISDEAMKSCFLDLSLRIELAPLDGLSFRFKGSDIHALFSLVDREKADNLLALHESYKNRDYFHNALRNAVGSMGDYRAAYVSDYKHFDDLNEDQIDFLYQAFYGHSEPEEIRREAMEYEPELSKQMLTGIITTFRKEYAAIVERGLRVGKLSQEASVMPNEIVINMMSGQLTIDKDGLQNLLSEVGALLNEPYEAYCNVFDLHFTEEDQALRQRLLDVDVNALPDDKALLAQWCVDIQRIGKIYH